MCVCVHRRNISPSDMRSIKDAETSNLLFLKLLSLITVIFVSVSLIFYKNSSFFSRCRIESVQMIKIYFVTFVVNTLERKGIMLYLEMKLCKLRMNATLI